MSMRRLKSVVAAAAVALTALAAAADDLDVNVGNHSEPVLCAEKDNVYVSFASPAVRAFRIQAVHPAYIGGLVADRWAPDWTSCDIPIVPSDSAKVRRVTIFETPELQLVGLVYPGFWRPASVPVRVGERVVTGLHLVQLWVRDRDRAEEVLVVYPPDGYWRARPLPPAHLRWSAYGSSFLVGPVQVEGRPFVALKEIRFEPADKTFTLELAGGGAARLRLAALDQDRIVLDVDFDRAVETQPFAALRSMYVTETNADVSRAAWRGRGDKGWREAPIMEFAGGAAAEFWAGRHVPSRHNTSAPDMVFGRFRASATPAAAPR